MKRRWQAAAEITYHLQNPDAMFLRWFSRRNKGTATFNYHLQYPDANALPEIFETERYLDPIRPMEVGTSH
jgi:hypothetical protein